MTVSIITPAFNSEATIKTTIESVLNQTVAVTEYIIVDGLSTDTTLKIAEGYREAFLAKGIEYTIISEKDDGIYDAMNKGIMRSTGDIVGIINSDDYYDVEAIAKILAFYKKTDYDIMYGDLRIFSDKSDKEYIKVSKATKRFNTRFWNHPTTFVARRVYQKLQYANATIYDDLDFMLAARAAGFKIEILNETLASFRLGGVSNKRSIALMKERIAIRNAIYKKHGCKGYRLSNFVMEFAKYILAK